MLPGWMSQKLPVSNKLGPTAGPVTADAPGAASDLSFCVINMDLTFRAKAEAKELTPRPRT